MLISFSDNILIKVPVSWKIVPIVSSRTSPANETVTVKTKTPSNSHLKTNILTKTIPKRTPGKTFSSMVHNKDQKIAGSYSSIKPLVSTVSKVPSGEITTCTSITTFTSISGESPITCVQSPNKFTKPSTVNFTKLKTIPRKLLPTSSVGWKINSPKSFVLEDVIKTNNFNITKFSEVGSSDSGDTCLDSVTLNYSLSEATDKNDVVIDSGYNNEKNQCSNTEVELAKLKENCRLLKYSLTVDSKLDEQELKPSDDKKINSLNEYIKSCEQNILNPKKKLIERAKYSMNYSDEGNSVEQKTKIVLANQNNNDDLDNNNIKATDSILQESGKNPISQNISKIRKVYKHLSNQKTNCTEGNPSVNSTCSNIKNSLVALGKINIKSKNNIKTVTPNTSNKITKHRKYTKKDLLNFRKKLKSPPIPESIKNIKIKEVYPDHWNCIYCSKEITYNDIYDHSTTCLQIDTDEYGKHLICCICKYATMKLSNLRKHIWTHTGEKPFKCTKCPYNSTQSSNLRIHLKIKHGIIN